MTLLEQVVEVLEDHERRFVVIGAAAMAVHGVSRSTLDLDLFTTDAAVLLASEWDELPGSIHIDRRFGDHDDPLAGLIRFETGNERPIDLIVGHGGWQEQVLENAQPAIVGGVELMVARIDDLVVLKLYAGGPQDLADAIQLLAIDPSIRKTIVKRLESLPSNLADSWRKVALLLS